MSDEISILKSINHNIPLPAQYLLSNEDVADCLGNTVKELNEIETEGAYILNPIVFDQTAFFLQDYIEQAIKKIIAGTVSLFIPVRRAGDHWVSAEVTITDGLLKNISVWDPLAEPSVDLLSKSNATTELNAFVASLPNKQEIKLNRTFAGIQTKDSHTCGMHVMRYQLRATRQIDHHPLAQETSNDAEDLLEATTHAILQNSKQEQENFDDGLVKKIKILESAYKAKGVDIDKHEDAIFKQAFDNQLYNSFLNDPDELMKRYREGSSRFFVMPEEGGNVGQDNTHTKSGPGNSSGGSGYSNSDK